MELGAPNPKESPRDSPHGSPQGGSRNPPSTQAVPGADGEYVGLPGGPARPEKRTMLGMLGGLMRPNSRGKASWKIVMQPVTLTPETPKLCERECH